MNITENKDELLERVRKVKRFLKHKKIKRGIFFDSSYGAVFDSEHARLINLWQERITDEDFTKRLEDFAENPASSLREALDETWERFILFEKWYLKCGGAPLTIDQIEDIYPKFKL